MKPRSARRLVLLGDSILDNAPYTRPAPDTAAHLRRHLGTGWTVDLLAQDGARMRDVQSQLDRITHAPDKAILSVGGNDAIQHVGLLSAQSANAADLFGELLSIADAFEGSYTSVAAAVAERVPRTVLCTIYDVRLDPPLYARLVRVPLAVLNDRIVRTAMRLGLDVLELRAVCTEREDFTLQIEPSAQGADKIAAAIAGLLQPGDAAPARLYPAPLDG